MRFNAIEGIVENGRIRLLEAAPLPEKAKVYVIIADTSPSALPQIRSPRLARPEQSGDFRKRIVEPVSDAKL
jgi:hypothetical protein